MTGNSKIGYITLKYSGTALGLPAASLICRCFRVGRA